MPGVNSTGSRYEDWGMEYDHYQHYFYDDHDPDEDFFKSTAPSEDIWKKFELVPTPPMSPIRTLEGSSRVGLVCPSLGDKLEWVSQFLGQDDEQDFPCKLSSAEETFGNLSSIIIQDCMWSGFSASQQLEKVVGERLAPCSTPGAAKLALQAGGQQGGVVASGRAQCVPADLPVLSSLAADCVDPAAVLTFPLTGACKKQVSSGSESHTDSSDEDDEDDDEDEEDEEEIDVVTVDQQRKPRRLLRARQPVTITVRADPLDPCMKRFHISIHQQQHNYAAPSPDTLPPCQPPRKRGRHKPAPDDDDDDDDDDDALPEAPPHPRLASPPPNPRNYESGKPHVSAATGRPELPDADLAAASPSLGSASSPAASSSHPHYPPFKSRPRPQSQPSSPQSSDGEDTDKRKTHNFLERKRRNDLRSRFLSLRDEIPGLAECPKTPKVAILTQATEYLRQLHASERQRAQERRQLKAKQQQLLRRLAQLKCP